MLSAMLPLSADERQPIFSPLIFSMPLRFRYAFATVFFHAAKICLIAVAITLLPLLSLYAATLRYLLTITLLMIRYFQRATPLIAASPPRADNIDTPPAAILP